MRSIRKILAVLGIALLIPAICLAAPLGQDGPLRHTNKALGVDKGATKKADETVTMVLTLRNGCPHKFDASSDLGGAGDGNPTPLELEAMILDGYQTLNHCTINCQFPGPNVTARECQQNCSSGPCRTCCTKIGGGAGCTGGCP